MKQTSEAAFETAIEAVLLHDGYSKLASGAFDTERAIFPGEALTFIRETQAKTWEKLEALHGAETGERVLSALTKWLDTHGVLTTLRHGFKCFGKTLRIAFFRPAHGLNPELEARYRANRLGITRQLHFSDKNKKSLDYIYDASGKKLAVSQDGILKNLYCGDVVYDSGLVIDFILTPVGQMKRDSSSGAYLPQYNITDHLGNVRAVVN